MRKNVISNLYRAVISNILSIVISSLLVLIVPKVIGTDDYGSWQLYLFYASYIGFFHLGWEDGIYLRYTGLNYSELNARLFAGQIYTLMLFQLLIASVIALTSVVFVDDIMKRTVIIFFSIAIFFTNFNNLCNFILQITNRITEYSLRVVMERVIFMGLIIIGFVMGYRTYITLLSAQILTLLILSLIAVQSIHKLLRPEFPTITDIFGEAKANLTAGSKLMLANIASGLILGIIRYGISENWSISVFGKISLSISIAGFLLVAVNAASVVFFPLLKQIDIDKYVSIFLNLRELLSGLSLITLLLYYPLRYGLTWWLPQYETSLAYMVIIFPICVFESRVSLLTNTYLKALRQEKYMLHINIGVAIFSLFLTFIGCYVMHNLDFMVFAIVISFACRCIISELYLGNLLKQNLISVNLWEMGIITMFIWSGWCLPSVWGGGVFCIVLAAFLIYRKKKLSNALSWILNK